MTSLTFTSSQRGGCFPAILAETRRMGSCISCCGVRKKKNAEKEPLLPRHRVDSIRPSHNHIQKVAEIYAALSSGKLPTQDQLNSAIQTLQVYLADAQTKGGGYGPLSARGREFLQDFSELGQASLQFGLEKNCKIYTG